MMNRNTRPKNINTRPKPPENMIIIGANHKRINITRKMRWTELTTNAHAHNMIQENKCCSKRTRCFNMNTDTIFLVPISLAH